jgi:UDP:flavonoid glycosyltransferase YjiC (YdhE family)
MSLVTRKILFTAWPLRGHCVQLIALAQELRTRGHEVAFAVPRPGDEWLEGTDVPVIPWEPATSSGPGRFHAELDRLFARASRERSAWRSEISFSRFILDRYIDIYEGIRPVIERFGPHLLIAEHASLPPIEVACDLGIPCIRVSQFLGGLVGGDASIPHWATALPRRMTRSERLKNRAAHGVDVLLGLMGRRLDRRRRKRLRGSRPLAEILATAPLLVGSSLGLEIARPLPPRVHLVGPILPRRPATLDANLRAWLDGSASAGVVYVSFGTLVVLKEEQIQALLHGLSRVGTRVLWSLPAAQQRLLPGRLPEGVRVEPFVVQAAVLAHPAVRAFVTHCGRNGLHEALWHGRPLLCVPFFGDQHYNAARLVEAGAGIRLDKDALGWREIEDAATRLVRDPGHAACAARLGTILRTSGGLSRAMDIIECALEAGVDHWL